MIHYQLAGRNIGTSETYAMAEAELRKAERCNVVNSRLLPDKSFHDAAYTAVKTLLDDADALVTLTGWESNRLAVLEVAVARAIGMPVSDLDDHINIQE